MTTKTANLLNKLLALSGFEIRRKKAEAAKKLPRILNEFSYDEAKIAEYVLGEELTVTSPMRLFATMVAVKSSIQRGIEGDFVECGVWRGGNSIAAALLFDLWGASKKVYLFDTFRGMTEPDERDFYLVTGEPALPVFRKNQKSDHNEWVYSPISEVKQNFINAGLRLDNVEFIEGPVETTLLDQQLLPRKISTLRLDTDWYKSTLIELEVLYPLLSNQGSLLIDDYGSWDGARKATDEFLNTLEPSERPTLFAVDYDGRSAIKP